LKATCPESAGSPECFSVAISYFQRKLTRWCYRFAVILWQRLPHSNQHPQKSRIPLTNWHNDRVGVPSMLIKMAARAQKLFELKLHT